jgi:hypothetical protein
MRPIFITINSKYGKVKIESFVKSKSLNNNFSFKEWSPSLEIESKIKLLYFSVSSFYFVDVYVTLIVEPIRKDTYAVVFHHILSFLLIFISYIFRLNPLD